MRVGGWAKRTGVSNVSNSMWRMVFPLYSDITHKIIDIVAFFSLDFNGVFSFKTYWTKQPLF